MTAFPFLQVGDEMGSFLTNPGVHSSAEGATVSLSISATNPAGHPLSYSALGLPSGLSIAPDTGVITGTVDSAAAETNGGVYPVTVAADDHQGNNGSLTFTWTVTHTNRAPVLDNPGDQGGVSGGVVSLGVMAYDPDGDTLAYSASGLPSGLSINATTGVITGTLGSPLGLGYATTTVSASDGSLTASQTFKWFIVGTELAITNPGNQTNAEGAAPSLQISAAFPGGVGAFVVSGLPTGLSMNSAGLVSGTVAYSAAEDAAGGVYNVIVIAQDSYGDSGSVGFAWNVNDVIRPPTLTNPGAQTATEGGAVSLQIQASSQDGALLSYGASGLPAGLSIDPNSGLISGTVAPGAAEGGGGSYTTTVTVQDDAGHIVSQQLGWTITDVNTAPWLGAPLPQNNVVGDTASLQLHGGDVDGDVVSYSISGLPTGLSLNGSTGLISGTLQQVGSYTVTATDSDNSLTATQTFTWNVAASGPEVTIAINGTLDHADDVALLGGAPIPVVVTLWQASAGLHNVTLQLPGESSYLAALDRTFVQLANGGSATLWLTALQASAAEDDVQLLAFVDNATAVAGDGKLTNEQVTFEPDIKNPDTPKGMADRIPPTAITHTTVTLNVTLTKGQAITLTVRGNSEANGDAAFPTTAARGIYFTDLTQAGANDVSMYGQNQTHPGMTNGKPNAGNLKLYAFVYVNGSVPDNGVYSNGFSVAAIPIAVKLSINSTAAGDDFPTADKYRFLWGAKYNFEMKSDSGAPGDLDAVQVEEKLDIGKPTGAMIPYAGGLEVGGWNQGTATVYDHNFIGAALAKTKATSEANAKSQVVDDIRADIDDAPDHKGHWDIDQYFEFYDTRTGMDKQHPLIVTASGFHLTYDLSKYTFAIQRQPAKNNGAAPGVLATTADGEKKILDIK